MLVIVGVLVFIYNFIPTKTVFGRHVYAVGGKPQGRHPSPVSTPAAWTSCRSSTWASCPQWPLSACSRLASVTAQAGMEFEMDAIAASLHRWYGRYRWWYWYHPGAVIGAFVMGVLSTRVCRSWVLTPAVVKTIKGLDAPASRRRGHHVQRKKRPDLPLFSLLDVGFVPSAGADPT